MSANQKPNPCSIVAASQRITPRACEKFKEAVYIKPKISKSLKDIKQSNWQIDNLKKPPFKPKPERGR
jgi:hypothetical protein